MKSRKTEEVLKLFQELSTITLDRSDLVPMLPLGTYTLFKYRCDINQLPLIDLDLQNVNIIGVSEFRSALNAAYIKMTSGAASECE